MIYHPPSSFAYATVFQEVSLPINGVLNVAPFNFGGEEESRLKMLEILGNSGETELSYLLSNVSPDSLEGRARAMQ